MDQPIVNTKKPILKYAIGIGIFILLSGVSYLAINTSSSALYFPKNQILTGTVIQGEFMEVLTTNGTVMPSKTVQIDAFEGGVIDQIYVENGAWVKKGTPLLQLSNTALSLDFMNRETQIIEQINNLRNTRINLDQNKRNVQEQLVDIQFELLQQHEQFSRDSVLYNDKVITQTEYYASANYFHYLQQKERLLNERMNTDEKYRQSQMHRIDGSIQLMERNLEAVRKSLNQLTITAPMDGQLNSFQHEMGATMAKGSNIGRIDIMDTFHITALIDQYYLNQIQPQQVATIKLGGKTSKLKVNTVFPTVVNNQFEVRFLFTDVQPDNLRRGQSAPMKVELSDQGHATMVPKGSFYATGGGKHVYVLNGNEAHKQAVKLGRQNSTHIEVISGIQPGDEIIISPYTNFNNSDLIIIE